ncbi:MAG: YgdI/YgdR family lipoprotein [Armatimonadetes bacterium]|nr:YgdI/YgdR family lipoprotein [Armatimonadota bacterium]
MKKTLWAFALMFAVIVLTGCASSEPPADKSGVVPASEAPPMDSSAGAGGGGSSASDAPAQTETGP